MWQNFKDVGSSINVNEIYNIVASLLIIIIIIIIIIADDNDLQRG